MVKAKHSEVGLLLELPNETRKFPFRPCNRRQQVSAPTNIQQTTDENVKMFRMIKSPYANESLVYPAPSTINGAGMGQYSYDQGRLRCQQVHLRYFFDGGATVTRSW
jgi:hypothetical protein